MGTITLGGCTHRLEWGLRLHQRDGPVWSPQPGGTHTWSQIPSMDPLLQEHHPHSEQHSATGFAPESPKSCNRVVTKAIGEVTKSGSLYPGGLRHFDLIPGLQRGL